MAPIRSSIDESGRYVLQIIGDIDASSAVSLDREITYAIQNDYRHLILDFAGVRYTSSAGIGVFVSYVDYLKKNNGSLQIIRASKDVRRVLSLLGLDQLLGMDNEDAEPPLDKP